MKQLKTKTYTREEIAKEFNLETSNKNFARKVKDTLTKWGYSFNYSRKEVTITRIPTTADEKLAEILIREYNLDIRIDTDAFAAFFYSLVVLPEFSSMPWEERMVFLKDEFGVEVSDRTLRSWCSRLISTSTVYKDDSIKTRWITGYCNGEKYRELVDGDKELEKLADDYKESMKSLLEKYKTLENKEKWTVIRKELWDKYQCCIYSCKGISLAAFDNTESLETLQEMVELVNEIAEREPVETELVITTRIVTIPKENKENEKNEFKF